MLVMIQNELLRLLTFFHEFFTSQLFFIDSTNLEQKHIFKIFLLKKATKAIEYIQLEISIIDSAISKEQLSSILH